MRKFEESANPSELVVLIANSFNLLGGLFQFRNGLTAGGAVSDLPTRGLPDSLPIAPYDPFPRHPRQKSAVEGGSVGGTR